MPIRDVMTPRVTIVPRAMSLFEAARIMDRSGLPMMLVSDGGRTAGVLTDRAVRRALNGGSPGLSVGDAMHRRIPRCRDRDTDAVLERAAKRRQRRRMIVFNDRDQPIGVLDLADLLAEASGQTDPDGSVTQIAGRAA